MSRTRHWWYRVVEDTLKNMEKLPEDSKQKEIIQKALEEAESETMTLSNGELRIKAVNDVIIKRTKTVEEFALDVHYSDIRVRKWINSFINLLGKKAGY